MNKTDTSTISTAYDSLDNVIEKEQGNTNFTYTYYGEEDGISNKHLLKTVTNDGVTMTYTYDSAGNVTGTVVTNIENSNTLSSSTSYINNGTLVGSVEDGNGISVTYGYNSRNLLTSVTNAADVTTQHTYNEQNNREVSAYIEDIVSVNYNYLEGQLASIVRTGYIEDNETPQTQTYSFEYDLFGNTTKISVGNYTLVTYEYEDGYGNLLKTTYGNGNYIENVYDELDRIVEIKVNGETKYLYTYGGDGNLYSVEDVDNDTKTWYNYDSLQYYYIKNLQGDVVAIANFDGTILVEYIYDAWGDVLSITGTESATIGAVNPIRYRGYYYDTETGLYYVSSRYYDPEIGRWISPEPNVYTGAFDSGSGLIGYNVYAYCANNPVNFSDPTGEFILTALIVGVVAGAVIGGAIGGTVAYNSAKSSGLEGSDLFWATAGGVGKGALIGGVAGGLVGATGGVVAAYGATSVAGTAMITATATITAKATEVTALQAKKSTNDGDNGWQIANDCIDSVFSNGGKIISPALTKAGTTSATYVATDLIKHKVVPLGFNTFLHSAGGKVLPYGFAAYAWGHTAYSIFCTDPIARANQRGYGLR